MMRFYVYAALSGVQFTWTTWLAFVVAHGGNPGWAEASFHLAILLGEVPTGAVADLMGRRKSMIVGLLMGAVGPLGYFFIHDTLTACLVLAFAGLAGTFTSGADTALIYETAEGLGGKEYARKAMARINALQLAASTLGPVIGGFLYQWWEMAPFLGSALLRVITLAVVWGMTDRFTPPAEEERTSVWRQTAAAIRVVKANRPILVMLAFAWIYNTAHAMASQFAQAYFPAVGLTMGLAGITFGLSSLVSTGGSALAGRIAGDTANGVLRLAPAALGLGIMGMGLVAGLPGAVLAGPVIFALMALVDGTAYPIYQARFNETIPSAQRATILSLQSAGFSLLMSISFPAASYLPVASIYTVTGIVLMLFGVIWMMRRWSYYGESSNA